MAVQSSFVSPSWPPLPPSGFLTDTRNIVQTACVAWQTFVVAKRFLGRSLETQKNSVIGRWKKAPKLQHITKYINHEFKQIDTTPLT